MTIIEKIIANRMSVAFILFLAILVSFAPTVFLGEDKWLIISLLLVLFLISWLVYSTMAKKRLLNEGAIPKDKIDFIDNFLWDFKPNSKVKILFGAYGMTIGIAILATVILLIVSPDLIFKVAFSPLGFVLFCSVYLASYFILKKRLK